MDMKTAVIDYALMRNLRVYTINESEIVKIEHPVFKEMRLSIKVMRGRGFELSLFKNSRYVRKLRIVENLLELKLEICLFETCISNFVNADIMDDQTSLFEDMLANFNLGI